MPARPDKNRGNASGNRRTGSQEIGGDGSVHATTDQRRKIPSTAAKADHERMNPGDCRDHQDKMDSNREIPSKGSTRADNIDRTARTCRMTGVREVGATIHNAMPITNRPTEAVQRPALDRQRNAKAAIPGGETRPKTPMPTAKIETATTSTVISAPVSACVNTRRTGGSPPRMLDGM